jgi:hypothetical protein
LHRTSARTTIFATQAEPISRLTPIGTGVTSVASGSNFSVNSRQNNCSGYTVGICPSHVKNCACKSTAKRRQI